MSKNKLPRNICGAKHDYQFWDSENKNALTHQFYLARLSELAMSMFEWKNLPDTIDPRFLEYTLFYEGAAIFFKDEALQIIGTKLDTEPKDEIIVEGESDMHKYDTNGSYLALQVMLGGDLDVYRVPRSRTAYSVGYQYPNLNEENSVIIWNNMLRMPEYPRMMFYAEKLYEIDRTIDVNVKAQKTPIAILCNENERLTMRNVYEQYDGNQPFIFGSKDLDLGQITAIKTDAPFVADKLQTLKNEIWNEALTCLGISNLNVQKKERLVSDEVTRNMGGTIASRHSRMDMRRQACDEINKLFGLNVEVEYREDFRELDDEFMIEDETGDKGSLHVMQKDIRTNTHLNGKTRV